MRFYFKYEELIKHPNACFDGVLSLKVREKLILAEWVYAIVIPTALQKDLESVIPDVLKDRIIYIENDCKDIWYWSEKVYCMIENLHEVKNDIQSKKRRCLYSCKISSKYVEG